MALPAGLFELPDCEFAPGAVARSVLTSAFALNPHLRDRLSGTAEALINDETRIPLPPDVRLRLALTRGPWARVTGSMMGFYLFKPPVNGKAQRLFSEAQIYFSPLAWQLYYPAESNLPSLDSWGDATSWLAVDPHLRRPLRDHCPALPFVIHPKHDPATANEWSELFCQDQCFIVESDNALLGSWLRAKTAEARRRVG
jgi:hypothetical protein